MAKAVLDLETCSWCGDEVPDSSLSERPDGARICRSCRREAADPRRA